MRYLLVLQLNDTKRYCNYNRFEILTVVTDMPDQEQLCFRALADPTRRGILRMLAQREMTIAEVADNFEMTRAAVKKHLLVLSDGGLIAVRTEGRNRINTLDAAGLKQALGWFEFFDQFWDDRLAILKSEIEKDTP